MTPGLRLECRDALMDASLVVMLDEGGRSSPQVCLGQKEEVLEALPFKRPSEAFVVGRSVGSPV